jgi:hypothetical protein
MDPQKKESFVFPLHRRKAVWLAAVALAAASLTNGALADSTPAPSPAAPTTQDVNSRIDALQAEITQLRAEQKQQKAEAEQQTSGAVLHDAGRQSQFLDAQGVLAGYTNGKFVLQSEDGKYLAHPWLQFQFRNVTDYREKGVNNADNTQTGFEVRRLKFGADGNLFGDQLTYFTQFAVDRKSGNVQLEQAYAKYQFDHTPFAVRAGQFKDPFDHEQLLASKYFAPIDRTLTNDTFAGSEGFIKGVSLIYDPATFVRAEAGFTGGLKNTGTNFQQYPTTGITTDYGAAGRVEVKPFGEWKEYDKGSAYGAKTNTLVFGAGADFTEAGDGQALSHVVDAQLTTATGWSLYAAYLGRYFHHNPSAKNTDTYDPTVRVQASWAIDKKWEPYARYEYIHFDGKEFAAGTTTNVHVLTAGFNYYVFGQSLRVSLDANYLPNGSPVADDGIGVLTNNGRNIWVGRAQVQLLL